MLDRILAAGFDVHALDLRRCGRAQFSVDGERVVDEMLAHDSYDFHEYFEEMDATLKVRAANCVLQFICRLNSLVSISG